METIRLVRRFYWRGGLRSGGFAGLARAKRVEIDLGDRVPFALVHGPLDSILELADIAGPVVMLHAADDGLVEGRRLAKAQLPVPFARRNTAPTA